ncbi:MAG: phosphoglycerate mutase [Pseudomonadota bacterium]|nr:phosphoglycerate mutase [Pseudomonadota bacterium]
MTDKLHLIIAGVVLPQMAGESAPPFQPMTKNLRDLLAAMVPHGRIECGEDDPSTPFELALAQANGLPDAPGHIPWAAFETGTTGTPCAFIQLCHWQVGADHVRLSPPDDLALDEASASTLLAAMAPYFREDGITLAPHSKLPGTWLATGEVFRGLHSVSMGTLMGRHLTRSLLDGAGTPAATLRRLQNEMQMLLYTHPANEARQQHGLAPVNFSGSAAPACWTSPFPPRRACVWKHACRRRRCAVMRRPMRKPGRRWTPTAAPPCWPFCVQAARRT